MSLTTLLAQAASVLRAKFSKAAMKCKIIMLFKFWGLFLKMYIFVVKTFYLAYYLYYYYTTQFFQWYFDSFFYKIFASLSDRCYNN